MAGFSVDNSLLLKSFFSCYYYYFAITFSRIVSPRPATPPGSLDAQVSQHLSPGPLSPHSALFRAGSAMLTAVATSSSKDSQQYISQYISAPQYISQPCCELWACHSRGTIDIFKKRAQRCLTISLHKCEFMTYNS